MMGNRALARALSSTPQARLPGRAISPQAALLARIHGIGTTQGKSRAGYQCPCGGLILSGDECADCRARRLQAIKTGAASKLQRQSVGETRQRMREDVPVITSTGSGIWEGTVTRHEIRETFTHTAGQPDAWTQQSDVSQGELEVSFNAHTCEVTIPTRLVFHNPGPGGLPSADPCNTNSSAPTRPLPTDTFNRLKRNFIGTINDRLNSWYTTRLDACGSGAPCANREIPIRVSVTESPAGSGPERDVWLINANGRSCASGNSTYVYASGGAADRAMWAHEGGHLFLRFGDEYDEPPASGDRVQESDYSGMGQRNMSRLALLHERHFAFVPEFLRRVMQQAGHPGCRPTLRQAPRPPVLAFNPMFGMGGFGGSASGMYLDLGVLMGIPLDRRRDWELMLGLHSRLLAGLDPQARLSFLSGARLGLDRTFSLSRFGYALNPGIFGETGAGIFSFDRSARFAPYAEGGGHLDLRFQNLGAVGLSLGLEGAYGGQIGASGGTVETGGSTLAPPAGSDPQRWFRFGLTLGLQL